MVIGPSKRPAVGPMLPLTGSRGGVMADSGGADTWPPEAHDQRATTESAGAEFRDHESSPAVEAERELVAIGTDELRVISDRLDQLRRLFEARGSEAEQREQWATQLISQLTEYRDDFVFKNILGKVFRDLIQLHDTLGQTLDAATYHALAKEDVIARLQSLHRQLLRIFDRQGIEQIETDGRTQFDETEQEAIDARPVDRPEDDGIVLESARCGFRYGTRLLRPESVVVGRYERKDPKTYD